MTPNTLSFFLKKQNNKAGCASVGHPGYASQLTEIYFVQGKHNEALILNEREMEVHKAAPTFELLNTRGELVSLESLKGKVVILDFGQPSANSAHFQA